MNPKVPKPATRYRHHPTPYFCRLPPCRWHPRNHRSPPPVLRSVERHCKAYAAMRQLGFAAGPLAFGVLFATTRDIPGRGDIATYSLVILMLTFVCGMSSGKRPFQACPSSAKSALVMRIMNLNTKSICTSIHLIADRSSVLKRLWPQRVSIKTPDFQDIGSAGLTPEGLGNLARTRECRL